MPPIAPIYIHIPKTGGTSILAALGQKRGLHLPVQDAGFQKRLRRTEKSGRTPLLFTVFRNPLDRLVSLFHYYHAMDLSSPRTQENVLLAHIAKAYPDCDAFWSSVDPPSLANATVMFRPQRWFFKKARRPVVVIPFGNGLAERVKARIGLEIPHLNRSRHGSPEEELGPKTIRRLLKWMARDQAYWDRLTGEQEPAAG